MTTFTKAEQATITPLITERHKAQAAADRAGEATVEAEAHHTALLDHVASLGSEPQPVDFDTAAAWQAAHAEHRFAVAKLQPGIAPLAAKVADAYTAHGALLPAIENAEIAIRVAETKVFAARVATIAEQAIVAVVAFERSNATLPSGHHVARPDTLAFHPLPFGMVTVGVARNVDPSTVAVD